MLKKLLEQKLKFLARQVLKKYQPKIIAITGSVGKTSTREAIACVLSAKFSVRQNRKNYNNEIGLPLTILDIDSPGKSLTGWLGVVMKAIALLVVRDKNFPQIMVLEMGVDHPGDMEYLTAIAKPDISVVTTVGQSHLEYFGSEENLAKEKGVMVKNLNVKGFAVLNYDDERVRRMEKYTKARILYYGFDEKCDVRAMELKFSFNNGDVSKGLYGLSYKLKYQGSFVPVHLTDLIGLPAVYASLAAASVGLAYDMNIVDISQALSTYRSPKGRMRLVSGIRNSLLIDDTYNASPQSTLSAVETVGRITLNNGCKRWAVLGDMLELGGYTVTGHQEVGLAVAKNNYDYLVAVGERSILMMAAARDAGMAEDCIFHFASSTEAAIFVRDKLVGGDILLIKGSQGMRMERVTKELLMEPQNAKELLIRQDWLDA